MDEQGPLLVSSEGGGQLLAALCLCRAVPGQRCRVSLDCWITRSAACAGCWLHLSADHADCDVVVPVRINLAARHAPLLQHLRTAAGTGSGCSLTQLQTGEHSHIKRKRANIFNHGIFHLLADVQSQAAAGLFCSAGPNAKAPKQSCGVLQEKGM